MDPLIEATMNFMNESERPSKGSVVITHDNKGNPTTGKISRWDVTKDSGEITWDKGHRMASDWYIFRISTGPAFVKHGNRFHIIL